MEPLKNCFNFEFVKLLGERITEVYPEFNARDFVEKINQPGYELLELKQRMRLISETLSYFLPSDYSKALSVLIPVSRSFSGLSHLVFSDYVEVYGTDHFDESMAALAEFTIGSSAEFAIRPYLKVDQESTLRQMKVWSKDKNEHLRRLASEGTRPRLPWAMSLPKFKKNPKSVLDIIEPMIGDKSLYVRRSVANNLNDISKDNPELTRSVARKHLGKSKDSDWTIKHGCRTLLKSGDTEVLSLFGYRKPEHIKVKSFKFRESVEFGAEQEFAFELNATKNTVIGQLRLEFAIGFKKANGTLSSKVFKISEGIFNDTRKSVTKKFSFKPITTRKYYPGEHTLSLVINGKKVNTYSFELLPPS